MFTWENGRAVHPEVISKTFTRLTRTVGLRQVRFHDLRHGSASLQLAARVDIAVLSKRLGHSQVSMTSDVYSHLIGGVGKQAADAAACIVPRRTREA